MFCEERPSDIYISIISERPVMQSFWYHIVAWNSQSSTVLKERLYIEDFLEKLLKFFQNSFSTEQYYTAASE